MPIPPADFLERVYAGVLGKIVGVYLGRPFEGWSFDDILEKLGPIEYYVHERLNKPLVVADDDISGTFTFLRALPDYGNPSEPTAEQIGSTWLNYIIENKTILWWGGMGVSTEHTAYLRLKQGMPAKRSGSIETNGQLVAEQIGAQIFIDGWGLVNPGDPERAAAMAATAASVSHDGEAIYGAQVIASMVAQAFVEPSVPNLLDTAVDLIPAQCVIAGVIRDVREWHAQGLTWQAGFERIRSKYGYDKFGGGCHVVPNHALVVHALLHGNADFQRSLMIVNTLGWDTDCNSGNVGCILGVAGGLSGIDAGPDWRGPVADRMILPTADGGRCITDAASEAIRVANIGLARQGLSAFRPKDGARFHFALRGSVQGFRVTQGADSGAEIAHDAGRLAILLSAGRQVRIATDTFPSEAVRESEGYGIAASPTLYPGQTIRALVAADLRNGGHVDVALVATSAGAAVHRSNSQALTAGQRAELMWRLPDLGGNPCETVGLEFSCDSGLTGSAYLDWLTWDGSPDASFRKAAGTAWKAQWVNGVSSAPDWGSPFRLIQNEGAGLFITGTREWTDYVVEAEVTPHLCASAGIACRVQGMRRYYALVLCRDGCLQLVKALDGEIVLARQACDWAFGEAHRLALCVTGNRIVGSMDGAKVFAYVDEAAPLLEGGIAYVLTEGCLDSQAITVRPIA